MSERNEFQPPDIALALIDRVDLLGDLNQRNNKRLSIFHGPVGFGKTVLMSQWFDYLVDKGITATWTSLNHAETQYGLPVSGDLWRTLEHLKNLNCDQLVGSEIDEPETYDFLFLLMETLRVVFNHGVETFLFLDNLDRLSGGEVATLVQPLIDHAPVNLHIVISIRDISKIKIADLQAKGLVNYLSSSELAFTNIHAASLKSLNINKLYPLKLVDLSAKANLEKTKGWPAAYIILEPLVLTENSDGINANELLHRYFSETLFEKLEPSLRQFLIDASWLDTLTSEALDFIREQSDSAFWLEQAANRFGLIFPHDQVANAFVMPAVLKDFCVSVSRESEYTRTKNLQYKAGQWFFKCRKFDKAFDYFNLAGKTIEVLGSSEGGVRLFFSIGAVKLSKVIASLDDFQLSRAPYAVLLGCLSDGSKGNISIAKKKLAQATANLEMVAANYTRLQRSLLLRDLGLLECLIHFADPEPSKSCSLKFYIQRLEKLSKDNLSCAVLNLLLSVEYRRIGQFDDSLRCAEIALMWFTAEGCLYGHAYALLNVSYAQFHRGQSESAFRQFTLARKTIRHNFRDDTLIKLSSLIYFADACYSSGKFELIPREFKDLPKLLEGIPLDTADFFLGSLLVAKITASTDSDLPRINSGALSVSATEQCLNQKLIDMFAIKAALKCFRVGDQSAALLRLEKSNLSEADIRCYISNSDGYLMRELASELALSQVTADAKNNVIADLNDAALSAPTSIAYQLRRLYLTACFLEHKKQYIDAGKAMLEALELAIAKSVFDCFYDKYKLSAGILIRLRMGADVALAQKIDIVIGLSKVVPVTESQEDLSGREKDVVRCLVLECSNKTIARKLNVSDNTVRFHLKNIFSKLGVKSRKGAVDEVSKRGLLK